MCISEDTPAFEHLFKKGKIKGLYLNKEYSDDKYIVWDHDKKITIDFEKIQYSPTKISRDNYIKLLKNYFLGRVNNDKVSAKGEAKRIKEIIKISEETQGFRKQKNYTISADLRNSLVGFLEEANIEVNPDYFIKKNSDKNQRKLSDSFITYYVIDDELKKFWNTANEKEKIIFFPFYLFWVICNIIPTRPYEFCITAYDCLVMEKGSYYLLLRKSPNKGTVRDFYKYKKKINDVRDYPYLSVWIPPEIGKEILWYKEQTKEFNKDKEFLFSNGAINKILEKKYQEHFNTSHLSTLKEMFTERLIKDCGYEKVQSQDDIICYSKKWVGDWHLGDLRHLALINMVENQVDPGLIMRYAGHSDISSACHYYTNASEYSRSRIFYMDSKVFEGGHKGKREKHVVKTSVPVEGGECFNNLGVDDNCCVNYDACKNCKHFEPNDDNFIKKSNRIDNLYKHFIKLIYKKEIENAHKVLVELQNEVSSWEGKIKY